MRSNRAIAAPFASLCRADSTNLDRVVALFIVRGKADDVRLSAGLRPKREVFLANRRSVFARSRDS